MTRQEHLLACLTEECAEVIKEVCKIQRFGPNDHHPDIEDSKLNVQRLKDEIVDLIGVVDMLQDEKFIDMDILGLEEQIEAKKARVEKYILYAKEKGTVK